MKLAPRRAVSFNLAFLAAIALLLGLNACAGDGSDGSSSVAPVFGSSPPDMELGTGGRPGTGGVQNPGIVQATPILPEGSASEVRVGLLLPLSGPRARLGEALLKAAQLALFDADQANIGLVVRDTKGTAEGAREAAAGALAEGAALIVGPFFASSVTAVAPQARAKRVTVIAFSNDPAAAGEGVYLMGLPPAAQVDRVVAYASRQGLRRFAVLAPRSRYGNSVVAALYAATQRNGSELVRVGFFDPGERDISAVVRQLSDYDERHAALLRQRKDVETALEESEGEDEELKAALERLETLDTVGEPGFDAVLLPLGGSRLRTIAPLFPFYDVDPEQVRFLGTALWNDARLSSEPSLVGGWFAAPPPELWAQFRTRYVEAFGEQPPRFASLAYDAAALAVLLLSRPEAQGNPSAFAALRITQPSGFTGVDGILRFLPSGVVERGLAVMEMRRGELQVIEVAPETFERLVN